MKVELSELEIEEIIREHFGGKIQNYRMSKVSSWTLGRNNRKISTEKVFVTLDVENENDTEKFYWKFLSILKQILKYLRILIHREYV